MKTIYVTGSAGLVGSRFVELFSEKYRFLTPEIDELDITKKTKVSKFIKKEKPDAIVHFAAYTNVGEAEDQGGDKNGLCWKINVNGTRNLVDIIDPQITHFIQISTDYVFPGSKKGPGPYDENHKPASNSKDLTWYGYTKAMAEKTVLDKLGKKATILRIIYPVRAKYKLKADYLRKPLELYDQGKLYPMFSDQQVSITFIDEACMVLNKIIEGKIFGTFHASSSNISTPHELISYLIEKTRGVKNAVVSQSIDDFIKKTKLNQSRYPKYGGFKIEKTEKKFGIKFSSWKQIIDKLVKQGLG